MRFIEKEGEENKETEEDAIISFSGTSIPIPDEGDDINLASAEFIAGEDSEDTIEHHGDFIVDSVKKTYLSVSLEEEDGDKFSPDPPLVYVSVIVENQDNN